MINLFKTNTVDTIVSNLTKTIDNLTKVREKHLFAADVAKEVIELSKKIRDENLTEAARAEKIANNVKKLLDIS